MSSVSLFALFPKTCFLKADALVTWKVVSFCQLLKPWPILGFVESSHVPGGPRTEQEAPMSFLSGQSYIGCANETSGDIVLAVGTFRSCI